MSKNPMEDLYEDEVDIGEEAIEASKSLDILRRCFKPWSETHKLLTEAIRVCDIMSGEAH